MKRAYWDKIADNYDEELFDVLSNDRKQLKSAAHFILVVPAIESAMFVDSRLIEWNLKQGTKPRDASRERFFQHRKRDVRRLREGLVAVDGVSTKHYLREEMIALLEKRKMTILDAQKIEYGWDTEFARPPRWMKSPYPWDWLVVSRKES